MEWWHAVLDFAGTLGGLAFLVLVLSAWLGKVWANRILEQDRARRAKDVFAHRLQFEKEFGVYVKLWSALVDLVAATSSLRPVLDHVDRKKTDDDIKQERLERLVGPYEAFRAMVHKHRPFYAPEVHDAARQLLRDAFGEALDYKYEDRHGTDYWKKALENADKLREGADQVCEAIRHRIWSVQTMAPNPGKKP